MNDPATLSRPRRWLRWLKRLGWCALWLVTLVALVVVVENWRGRRAWEGFVAEARAAGEKIEPLAVIPPPFSDAENFAAIPLFQPLFDVTNDLVNGGKRWRDPAARDRVQNLRALGAGAPPKLGSWREGKFADLAALQAHYRGDTNFPSPPQPGKPGEDVLVALGKFDPELNQLQAAAARPHSRFPINWEDGIGTLLPHLQPLRHFGQMLEYRALANLSLGRTDAALDDTLLTLRLGEAVASEPCLISQLVNVALLEMAMPPLWEGLARHEWSDAQLATLERRLAPINLAANHQQAFRGERNILLFPGMDTLRDQPDLYWKILHGMSKGGLPTGPSPLRLFPSGWCDQNKVTMGRLYGQLVKASDPAARRFLPDEAKAVEAWLIKTKPEVWRHPHYFLAVLFMPSAVKPIERCASMQATVDLARVAIALERHRLKHGALPETLAALDTAVLPVGGLPRDVITGEPLRYVLTADGKFKLYSTGWDRVDDGGVPAFIDDNRARIDFTKGDWVWPQPAE